MSSKPGDDERKDPYDYESIFAPEPPPPPLKERINVPLLKRIGLAVVAVVVVLIVIITIAHQFSPSGQQGKEVVVDFPDGAGLNSVGPLLADKGVIPSALAFKIYDKVDRKSVQFKAGEYAFRSNSSVGEAMAVLQAGPKAVTSRLTIPEGFRIRQIADKVGTVKGLSADKFYELATNNSVRSRYQPEGNNDLEGFLFPDTYLLSPEETELSLLKQMVAQSDNVAGLVGLDNSLSKTSQQPYETMIIASMIEAEAKTDGDRGKISRVILNRLFQAMPLQIDATVLYGMGNTTQTLSNKDLQTNTAYNTYTNKGLPPGPICNPGRASILAAMNPTTGPWLYYVVSDAQGNHAFAETYEEHLKNVAAARAKGLL